ncbi:hypothetical protein Aperf_G00000069794 [Anoplocephala perfoliata]
MSIVSSAPLSDETTHKADYVPHPIGPRKLKKELPQHVPEGKFEGQSVYNSEYTEKVLVTVKPFMPQVRERNLDKFDGEATYTADYKEWDVEPHRNFGPKNEYHQPMDEFKGESIYTTDYIDRGLAKPPNTIRPAAHPTQSGPFDAISTFTADYVPKNVEKQRPFRPEYTPVHSDTPFAKETTHNVDYTEKPLPEHYHRCAEEYKPSNDKFDGSTTYRLNYTPLEGERAKMLKPAYEALDPNRKFSDMTNYKKEYRKWSLKERASPARGPPRYLPPETPFDGQTIYQNDYIAKQPETCPVLQLHSNPDIICEGEDECGHEFYSTRNQKKQKDTTLLVAAN